MKVKLKSESKIVIEFKANDMHLDITNCSHEQLVGAIDFLQEKAFYQPVEPRDDMEELLLCLEVLLVSCEHPESSYIESAQKLMPIGVRHLVDFYREKRRNER